MRDGSCYPTLILEYNAGPLGTAASLHAALAIHNVTLLEAPWVNRETETDVVWPSPEVVEDYALSLKEPGLGIEANEALVDEALAASKPFVSSPQPRLDALDGAVRVSGGDEAGQVQDGNRLYKSGYGCFTHRNPKYAGPNCFSLGHTFPS